MTENREVAPHLHLRVDIHHFVAETVGHETDSVGRAVDVNTVCHQRDDPRPIENDAEECAEVNVMHVKSWI